jgi:hypothetical protein
MTRITTCDIHARIRHRGPRLITLITTQTQTLYMYHHGATKSNEKVSCSSSTYQIRSDQIRSDQIRSDQIR